MKIGERVGVILGGKPGAVDFLGYGVYEGMAIPVEAVGFFADGCREHGISNPRIRLDSGQVVYGCECWWGPEAVIKDTLERPDVTVKMVDIDIVRATFRAAEAAAAKLN